MIARCLLLILPLAVLFQLAQHCPGQAPSATPDEAVRVRVSLNADGSRTSYQVDKAKHEAIATTVDEEGNPKGKVVYRIDDTGRFLSGMVYGPDEKFVFKTLYKYNAAGQLEEETHVAKDEAIINKVVYKYDPAGRQIGYAIFDKNGKLTSGTVPTTPSPTPSRGHNALGR